MPHRTRIALRTAITLFVCAVIAIVALTTTVTTVVFSYRALRAIGTSHTTAIGESARLEVETFFNSTVRAVRAVQSAVRWDAEGTYSLPSDMRNGLPTWGQQWSAVLMAASQTARTMGSMNLLFRDRSQLSLSRINNTTGLLLHARCCDMNNTTGLDDVLGVQNWYYIPGNSDSIVEPIAATALSHHNGYSRIVPGTQRYDSTRLALVRRPAGTVYIPPQLTPMRLTSSTDLAFVLVSFLLLTNSSGVELGLLAAGVAVSDISTFLLSIRTTRHTQLFLVDAAGYLAGVSTGRPYYYVLPDGATMDSDSTACARTDCIIPDPLGAVTACRHSVQSYGFAPLSQLAATDAAWHTTEDMHTARLSVGGASYFYAVSRVRLGGAIGGDFRVVCIIPEADVIHDVVLGQRIAIIATVCIFLVCAAGAGCGIHYFLRPLSEIARRMSAAAALRDDASPVTELSRMREIYDLQDAYASMNAELQRIKCFVPQSVLLDTPDPGSVPVADACASVAQPSGTGPFGMLPSWRGGGGKTRITRTTKSVYGAGTDELASDQGMPDPGTVASVGSSGHAVAAPHRRAAERPRLNVTSGLRRTSVSIAALNYRRFHSAFFSLSTSNTHQHGAGSSDSHHHHHKHTDALLRRYDRFIALVTDAATEHGGFVDGFSGDRVFLTFNAVRACRAHRIQSVMAALQAVRAVRGPPAQRSFGPQNQVSHGQRQSLSASSTDSSPTDASRPVAVTDASEFPPFNLDVTCGVSHGAALVGNLGSSVMKRFCTIAPAFSQAATLERLCKAYAGVCCLAPRPHDDLYALVQQRCVDVVRLPSSDVLHPLCALSPYTSSTHVAVQERHESGANSTPTTGERGDYWLYAVPAAGAGGTHLMADPAHGLAVTTPTASGERVLGHSSDHRGDASPPQNAAIQAALERRNSVFLQLAGGVPQLALRELIALRDSYERHSPQRLMMPAPEAGPAANDDGGDTCSGGVATHQPAGLGSRGHPAPSHDAPPPRQQGAALLRRPPSVLQRPATVADLLWDSDMERVYERVLFGLRSGATQAIDFVRPLGPFYDACIM